METYWTVSISAEKDSFTASIMSQSQKAKGMNSFMQLGDLLEDFHP
jgi:hypothetical protein